MTLFSRLSDQANALTLRRLAHQVTAGDADADPEPLSFGSVMVARRLLIGQLRFGGTVQQVKPGTSPFGIGTADWEREAQGFVWLDDLATLASDEAQVLARAWTADWLKRAGSGAGPGWTLPVTADRLTRQISHFAFLRDPGNTGFNGTLMQSMRLAVAYLAKRATRQRAGSDRLRTLAAALIGAVELPASAEIRPLVDALTREVRKSIASDGTIPSRDPEELLRIFALLVSARTRLSDKNEAFPEAMTRVIAAIAPVLRTLRHADGALARFHGADRGAEGLLDRALAFSAVRTAAPSGTIAMGYCRLTAGRTSVIADVARPPPIGASAKAHASVLAFELTSGRRPVVVNAGSGRDFGPDWELAGRATPSHSTLTFAGLSQARIALRRRDRDGDPMLLDHGPTDVHRRVLRNEEGSQVIADHNAYVPSHGLWHQRMLKLSLDGRQLDGEDLLEAREHEDRKIFQTAHDQHPDSFAFAIRFHLHPEARADVALNGAAVAITVKSGEVWMFRHDGTCDVALEPSAWLARDAARPAPSEQIVLTSFAEESSRSVRWTLSKAQDTPRGIRDLWRDDAHM